MKTKKIYRGRKTRGGGEVANTKSSYFNWIPNFSGIFSKAQAQVAPAPAAQGAVAPAAPAPQKAFKDVLSDFSKSIFSSSDGAKYTLPTQRAVTDLEFSNNKKSDGTRLGQKTVYEEKSGENVVSSAINSTDNFLERMVGSVFVDLDGDENKTKYEDKFKTVTEKGPELWMNTKPVKKGGKKSRRKIKKSKRKTKHCR